MKSSWIGIGFSHQSVPSLSNVAMRSDGGTKCGPSSVTERTKSRIASLLVPSFQLPSTSSFATARPTFRFVMQTFCGHPTAIAGC